jgi:acylphosphatase
MNEAIRAIASGRVQMVMFRDFAQRKARGLGLVGTVKNLTDGTVEVIAEGPQEKLEAYIEKLKKGPLLARVDALKVESREPLGTFKDFAIVF